MSNPPEALAPEAPLKRSHNTPPTFRVPTGFLVAVGVVLLAFALPLWDLVRFSLGSHLYSHIVLIPLVSLYLVWLKRRELPAVSRPAPGLAIIFFAAGIVAIAGYWWAKWQGAKFAAEDALAATTLAWLLLLAGACAWFLGREVLRAIQFPLAMLAFMIPFPIAVVNGIEFLLQHGSAWAALGMFRVVGTPLFQHGLVFELPNFTMQVAPECSGIHSTLALLITSLIAGSLFLRSTGARVVLAVAVIPLALLRNGLRIFTIGELCVRISPDMINSYIHHRGGPIFFALSLVPFSLLLLALVKWDRRKAAANHTTVGNS